MKPWPMVMDQPRTWALVRPWPLALLLLLVCVLPLPAQEDGIWRLQVRHNVTRGEADRALTALEDIPGIEIVELPNGAFSVYVGRYATEEDAQRAHDRFLETGVRLGTPTFIPTATPTPGPPTPTPVATPSTQPIPLETPEPAGQPPESLMGTTGPPPPSTPSGDSPLPLGVILAILAAVIVVGAGVYLIFLRKRGAAPPPPVNVKPVIPPPPVKARPKPVSTPAVSRPEPKPTSAPAAGEFEPAKPSAIDFAKAAHDSPAEPPPARQPIAMPEPPTVDPTPSIILNDIFEDEPETPASATPLVEEGPRLDFLMDDDAKASSAAGNGSSGTGDEGLGVPFNLGATAAATPAPESTPQRNVPTGFGAGTIIFEQDLSEATPDYAPPGWTGSYDYAKLKVVKDPESGEGPHMRFEKETGIGSAYYSCQFPEAHGRLAVDFEIRCDDKNKYLLGFYIEKDQDFRQSIHALIHRTNAKANPVLRLQNESVPYEFGTWRRVRYEIDLVRHIIDGFVDEEPVIVGQRLTSCPDGLNTLSIRDNLATTGVLLLKGIRITTLD